MNRLVHAILIPVELCGVFATLGDVSLLLLILNIYLVTQCHMQGGVAYGIALGVLWWVSKDLGTWLGLIFFFGGLVLQTQIGHRLFEKGGRDNTKMNLKELAETWDPRFTLMIFFHHFMVECFLNLFPDPLLSKRIDEWKEEEKKTFSK